MCIYDSIITRGSVVGSTKLKFLTKMFKQIEMEQKFKWVQHPVNNDNWSLRIKGGPICRWFFQIYWFIQVYPSLFKVYPILFSVIQGNPCVYYSVTTCNHVNPSPDPDHQDLNSWPLTASRTRYQWSKSNSQ